ncbi:Fe-Mn family superoxide dismutase [Paenibacillus shirakamiensis]|uniref:superoxide dismutase n=1 Tax=Paenibacillus shirakamiensis TaxID=1265935 RepID=A0ABS4JJ23_9BACL|nr:Fe-Mn family superoxide dismutase [Paenibacillus shirakamiensis]MBP2001703.1 Fe-Mn family superoxide dismutase [Paenibacillus shirakamiensis]
MLYVYGPYLPVRILEEIRFWKQIEKEHTTVILAIVPNLEPAYIQLLKDWEIVFRETEDAANDLLQHTIANPTPTPTPELLRQTHRLLDSSLRQSKEWIRQLYIILDQSKAIAALPLAHVVILHFIRESEYFVGVLETLNRTDDVAEEIIEEQHMLAHISTEQETDSRDQTQAIRSEEEQPISREPDPDIEVWTGPAVPIGGHKLPPLPYAYNALEPYIDEKTMRIHHDKHHQSYVDGLNKAEKKLESSRKTGDFDLVKHWERELAFNGAGHYLHTIFWKIMGPSGGGKPDGSLAEQIRQDFGSFDAFKTQFSKAAEQVEGSGWAILVWSPRSHRLEILTAEKHQNLSQWDVIPLLTLDVWEHAYYLKHQNERKKYIEDWWNVVYWPEVAKRYVSARRIKWQPF